MAGSGDLLSTQVDAGMLNVTAFAIQQADGSVSVIIVNKDATRNLSADLTLPDSVASATLLCLTQSSAGAAAPSLAAVSGVSIQGASVTSDGTFAPGQAYAVQTSGAAVTCYVPALSAILIRLS